MPNCRTCNRIVERYANKQKCRDCYNYYMREYMLNRYFQRQSEARIKLGGKCVDCQSTKDLEFDHIDPKQKAFDISKIWSYSKDKFWNEIAKCVLRCNHCHKEKTRTELSVEHGGGLTGKRNCYCDLCKPLKRRYDKKWKAANRLYQKLDLNL